VENSGGLAQIVFGFLSNLLNSLCLNQCNRPFPSVQILTSKTPSGLENFAEKRFKKTVVFGYFSTFFHLNIIDR